MNMFDGSDTSCWNSDQGLPQAVEILLEPPAPRVSTLRVMFQGGFVPTAIHCYTSSEAKGAYGDEPVCTVVPKDANNMQDLALEPALTDVARVKLLFPESGDFFGRITIYQLDLLA